MFNQYDIPGSPESDVAGRPQGAYALADPNSHTNPEPDAIT